MKAYAKVIGSLVLWVAGPCLSGPAGAGCLSVSVERDAIYAPGPLRLTVALTDQAKFVGNYQVKASLYLAGLVIREQTCPIERGSPVTLTWLFPEVRGRTEVRCRTELSLEGEFLHAKEYPVGVWPAAAPIETGDRPRGAWVLDASGDLQRAFSALGITVADAAFQGIRDFAVPSCVFVGEGSDVKAVQVVTERLSLARSQPVVVFLRQNRLVEDWGVRPVGEATQGPVDCDMNTPLLADLSRRDVMALVSRSAPLEIKQTPVRVTRSLLTGPARDEGAVRTCMALVNDSRRLTVYCQLPVMDPCDPRQVAVLHNLIRYAAAGAAAVDQHHKPLDEGRTP